MGRNLGKIVGAGLGWVLGGPIGVILGIVFGSIFDSTTLFVGKMTDEDGNPYNNKNGQPYSTYTQTSRGDFDMCIIVLSAAIMKVDGHIKRSELNFVKQFFLKQFGEEQAAKDIKILQGVLQQKINVYEVASQINTYMDYPSKLLLMQYLFGVANADASVSDNELDILQLIARYMNIPETEFESIKSMFVANETDYYKILEISPDATDEEVKKAYRELAIKHHPDKVAYLGEDAQRVAQEKFMKIQEAYEKIKLARGIA